MAVRSCSAQGSQRAELKSFLLQALGVLRGLHEIGKRVPADIYVVSFNNNDFAAFTIPSITSVDLKQHDVGIYAADLIYQLLHGETMKSINVQPELCIRESSGPAKAKKSS
jgi:DNA-binding LacI/PurR family transcriptional regulator